MISLYSIEPLITKLFFTIYIMKYLITLFQIDVYKDPITDPGKQSKKGNITLVRNKNDEFETKKREEITEEDREVLMEVFKNGEIIKEWNFEEVQQRVNTYI